MTDVPREASDEPLTRDDAVKLMAWLKQTFPGGLPRCDLTEAYWSAMRTLTRGEVRMACAQLAARRPRKVPGPPQFWTMAKGRFVELDAKAKATGHGFKDQLGQGVGSGFTVAQDGVTPF